MKDQVIYSYEMPPAPKYATPHDAHQAKMEAQSDFKRGTADRHKAHKAKRKMIPILL